MSHACHRFWKCYKTLTFCSLLTRCTIPCCGAFNILTSKCASRHNGVHFFDILTSKSVPKLRCFVHFHLEMCFAPQRRAIFHFSSGLRTRRFSEPTFRPSRATNHWKNTVLRDFPTFSRTCVFFLRSLSLFDLSSSDSSHLCFSSVHIVGSLTSKLPSTNYIVNSYHYHPFNEQ